MDFEATESFKGHLLDESSKQKNNERMVQCQECEWVRGEYTYSIKVVIMSNSGIILIAIDFHLLRDQLFIWTVKSRILTISTVKSA